MQPLQVANILMLKYHMMRNVWNYDSTTAQNQVIHQKVLFLCVEQMVHGIQMQQEQIIQQLLMRMDMLEELVQQ